MAAAWPIRHTGRLEPVCSLQIEAEFGGLKRFKLEPSAADSGKDAQGKPDTGRSATARLIESLPEKKDRCRLHLAFVSFLCHSHLYAATKTRLRRVTEKDGAIVVAAAVPSKKEVLRIATADPKTLPSAQLARRIASKWPRPKWHPPWTCYRVISGHLG